MASQTVITGDITKIESDALITAVNSSGLWFGGVDMAIKRLAGDSFHGMLLRCRPFNNLSAFSISAPLLTCPFKHVIFVVDDLQTPLRNVVSKGLECANGFRYETVTIPVMRSGVMMGIVEKTKESVANQIQHGIDDFYGSICKPSVKEIKIVVYNDSEMVDLLELGVSAEWPTPKGSGRKLSLE